MSSKYSNLERDQRGTLKGLDKNFFGGTHIILGKFMALPKSLDVPDLWTKHQLSSLCPGIGKFALVKRHEELGIMDGPVELT